MYDERLKKLRSQIDELLDLKKGNDRQQVTFENFGARSKQIMDLTHLVVTGKTTNDVSIGTGLSIEVMVDTDAIFLPASLST